MYGVQSTPFPNPSKSNNGEKKVEIETERMFGIAMYKTHSVQHCDKYIEEMMGVLSPANLMRMAFCFFSHGLSSAVFIRLLSIAALID